MIGMIADEYAFSDSTQCPVREVFQLYPWQNNYKQLIMQLNRSQWHKL
jgi:hypothetical protein